MVATVSRGFVQQPFDVTKPLGCKLVQASAVIEDVVVFFNMHLVVHVFLFIEVWRFIICHTLVVLPKEFL